MLWEFKWEIMSMLVGSLLLPQNFAFAFSLCLEVAEAALGRTLGEAEGVFVTTISMARYEEGWAVGRWR
jgi:hypothetical protein